MHKAGCIKCVTPNNTKRSESIMKMLRENAINRDENLLNIFLVTLVPLLVLSRLLCDFHVDRKACRPIGSKCFCGEELHL